MRERQNVRGMKRKPVFGIQRGIKDSERVLQTPGQFAAVMKTHVSFGSGNPFNVQLVTRGRSPNPTLGTTIITTHATVYDNI